MLIGNYIDVQSTTLKREVDLIQRISIVTTGRSWGKFYRITVCSTGLRFRRDVRQTISVSTNVAQITLYYSVICVSN